MLKEAVTEKISATVLKGGQVFVAALSLGDWLCPKGVPVPVCHSFIQISIVESFSLSLIGFNNCV